MKRLTWADFAKHKPCYNPAEKYGQWEGTILDLMHHPDIPANDKIWAFTRYGVVDDKTLRLFSVGCARRLQHLMTDKRSLDALDVAERYANGEATEDELAAARDAAWAATSDAARDAARAATSDATSDAAGYAARAAARAAAKDAARDAAWDAARAAARAAAMYAAWAAARAAEWETERKAQIQIAIELLTKLK